MLGRETLESALINASLIQKYRHYFHETQT